MSPSYAWRGACSTPSRVTRTREVCLLIAMDSLEALPAIDERLALPEAGYEIIDGVVTFVAPADPPHAEAHTTIAVLIAAHVHPDFKVAIDMLTRTSRIDDIAPDVSVFPRRLDPVTGGRSLEQLAFEIVSTQAMSYAATKAKKLADRGVRRVFAIDIVRVRLVEWSRELETWQLLDLRGSIDDAALAVPLSVAALLEVASTDDEVARALIAKGNPVIEAAAASAAARSTAQAVVEVLAARGVAVTDEQRALILSEREVARLDTWLRRAAVCGSVDEVMR